MKNSWIAAGAYALSILVAGSASASDISDATAIVTKWVGDFNKGDRTSLFAACTTRASIVDGFPPYAWQSCADWMKDYDANNRAIHADLGVLSYAKPVYTEVSADRAYVIYPATFIQKVKGKPVIYKGTVAMTLQKTPGGWLITGMGSAWGGELHRS